MRDPRGRRKSILALSLFAGIGLRLPELAEPLPLIVYNASASAPLGFYRVDTGKPITKGDLVLAHLPETAARFAADRGYAPLTVSVVKRVAALAGDLVCADSGIVVINDRVAADTLLIDREGRPLPAWHGCRVLAPGEVFLLTENIPASFDGRYFGPISSRAVIGKLVPLWTW